MKKILLIALIVLNLAALTISTRYALKYTHWYSKSQGYPGLYEQTKSYIFSPAGERLLFAQWESLAIDKASDGDIINWPDAKELFTYRTEDTVWVAVSLYNYLDLNEPMMSLAIENNEGRDWYGTVKDFKYKEMISAGYHRKGDLYYGYNFIGDKTGVCALQYHLATNSLYLGLPVEHIEKYRDKKFVVSVGQKSFWNDDFEELQEFSRLIK